jgi:ankyrin repeat protein
VASRNGHGDVVALLIKAGAPVAARTTGGATALHLAAEGGDTLAVAALLRGKADPNAKENEWSQTPLMFAAAANRADAVATLLANGADAALATDVVDLTARTAREQAAARKRNEVLFSFLPQATKDSILKAQTPARPAASAAAGATADSATQSSTDTAATKKDTAPLVYRATTNAPPTNELTPRQIQIAIDSGRAVLFAKDGGKDGVQVDTSDGQVAGFEGMVGGMGGMTALHHAVRQGNAEAAFSLLDGGADINQVTAIDSTSPLLLATINGHFDLAMQLVKRGADVKVASTAGATPLYAAINTRWLPRSRFPQPQAVQVQQTTHIELMTALLDAGADVNVRLKKNLWYFAFNNCGNANCGLEYLDSTTAFWRASYAVDVEAMRLLKARGADHTLPSRRVVPARGARGAFTPRTEASSADSAGARTAGASALGAGAGGGAAGAAEAVAAARPVSAASELGDEQLAPPGGRLGAQGRGGPPVPPLDPAIDSASKAVPPGLGVYPIHAAAGVGYGNGFAGNSHRHAPDGWMQTMKYLVEELGADVNQRDNNGYTPLHHAAARGDNEMIRYLVSKGADVKAVSRRGQTTVDLANGPVQRLRPFPETIALLESLGATNSNRCVSC